MKKFLNEFKEFAFKGNVINLAVGIIIGAAFQNIVTSLTTNILSPLVNLFVGRNFDSLETTVLGVGIQYGAFITSIINFLIMAFVIFLLVKGMTKIMSINAKSPVTRKCPFCMTDINIKATRCPACTSHID
jgi:large conductance mechanosensitive channel